MFGGLAFLYSQLFRSIFGKFPQVFYGGNDNPRWEIVVQKSKRVSDRANLMFNELISSSSKPGPRGAGRGAHSILKKLRLDPF